jgi:hypothetical protein
MMNSVYATNYSRTQTAIFVSDKMRNFLKLLVNRYGLNPEGVLDAWKEWVDRAVRWYLESGELIGIIIEFWQPGSDKAAARWDFPMRYDGNGVDEMWVDRVFFEEALAKATAPPAGCNYRIVLTTKPGTPDIAGVSSTNLRSTSGLTSREAGTVIATPDLMASARYYRC